MMVKSGKFASYVEPENVMLSNVPVKESPVNLTVAPFALKSRLLQAPMVMLDPVKLTVGPSNESRSAVEIAQIPEEMT